jgi:hypothetical protein
MSCLRLMSTVCSASAALSYPEVGQDDLAAPGPASSVPATRGPKPSGSSGSRFKLNGIFTAAKTHQEAGPLSGDLHITLQSSSLAWRSGLSRLHVAQLHSDCSQYCLMLQVHVRAQGWRSRPTHVSSNAGAAAHRCACTHATQAPCSAQGPLVWCVAFLGMTLSAATALAPAHCRPLRCLSRQPLVVC